MVGYIPNIGSDRIAPAEGNESEGMHFREPDVTGLSRRDLLRQGGLALTGITGAGLLYATSAFGKLPVESARVHRGRFRVGSTRTSPWSETMPPFTSFHPGSGLTCRRSPISTGSSADQRSAVQLTEATAPRTTSTPICGLCAASTSHSTVAFTPGRSASYELTCSIRRRRRPDPSTARLGARHSRVRAVLDDSHHPVDDQRHPRKRPRANAR